MNIQNKREKFDEFLTDAEKSSTLSPLTIKVYRQIASHLFERTLKTSSRSRLIQAQAVLSLMRKLNVVSDGDSLGIDFEAIRDGLKTKESKTRKNAKSAKYFRDVCWTQADMSNVLTHLPKTTRGAELANIICISRMSGMRLFEILKMQAADIEDSGTYLKIYVTGKRGKERLVFCPRLECLLHFTPFTITREYVFVTLRRIMRDTKQPKTFHGLRHTFASKAVRHGVGLREAQQILGHDDIATTEIYLHPEPECPPELLKMWENEEATS